MGKDCVSVLLTLVVKDLKSQEYYLIRENAVWKKVVSLSMMESVDHASVYF